MLVAQTTEARRTRRHADESTSLEGAGNFHVGILSSLALQVILLVDRFASATRSVSW